MAETSRIEWTDATWNPVTGCSVVSPGCTNCYAMRLAGTRLKDHPSRAGLTRPSRAGPVWTGEVRLNEGWLAQPLRWRRPRRIFVCAHGDLFHESVPDEWIDRVFAVMALAPRHSFQVLTKRAGRMREYVARTDDAWRGNSELFADRFNAAMDWNYAWINDIDDMQWPLPNVWLGVSVEDQATADARIPDLLASPAAARFVSAEPLLGPVDLGQGTGDDENYLDPECWGDCNCDAAYGYDEGCRRNGGDGQLTRRIGWVICGGESGPGARVWPGFEDAARSLRDQCAAAGVPFFMKQMAGPSKAAMPPIPADLLIRQWPQPQGAGA